MTTMTDKTETIRVLIVDDEERFREATKGMLERRGFTVTAVGDGLQAVDAVRANSFDVVVLDIKMPIMDGHAALAEIRKLQPALPVIMLTGHGTPQSMVSGLQGGVFDFLNKPCELELLTRTLRAAAARGGKPVSQEEALVHHVMVPLSSFSSIRRDRSVSDAVAVLLAAFSRPDNTPTVAESMHRSMLVMDEKGGVVGLLSMSEIMHGLQPAYMRAPIDTPMQNSIHLAPMRYRGLFTIMARDLHRISVEELMSDAPPVIDAKETLMAAVNMMQETGIRRCLVMDMGKPVGVIREHDLFFELSRILKIRGE
jgi:DNA-binding response OmpR family regulator